MTSVPRFSSAKVALESLLQIAENSLTVVHLAELDLQRADASWPADQTLRWMQQNGFDAAPIDEPEAHQFVSAAWLQPDAEPVVRQARPIDVTLLVSSDLGLADGVSRLGTRPFYFVLQKDLLGGIVTRADLQRPAVGMVLFSLILAAEAAMNVIIERDLGSSWIGGLSDQQQQRARAVFEQRLQHNTEAALMECVMLHNRLELLLKCPGAVPALGFSSKKQFREWKERLGNLRDNLAHGGGLLYAEPDPLLAIDLFERVRSFAEKLWEMAQERSRADEPAPGRLRRQAHPSDRDGFQP